MKSTNLLLPVLFACLGVAACRNPNAATSSAETTAPSLPAPAMAPQAGQDPAPGPVEPAKPAARPESPQAMEGPSADAKPVAPDVKTPSEDLRILDKPILWNAERRRLSLEYLELRHGIRKEEPDIEPILVVVHATEGPTVDSAFHTFHPVRMEPGERQRLRRASALNVSAHFVVDTNGDIYRLLPETRFARHTVGLNYCAIGIENVGGTPRMPLTDAQVEANARLIRHLARHFPIRHVIGHHEYLKLRGSSLWKETDPGYYTIKSDPGDEFMRKLREKLADLKFALPWETREAPADGAMKNGAPNP